MDGNDLQRRVGAQAAGKATRDSFAAMRQRQQPAEAGNAADCIKVGRHQAAERGGSVVFQAAAGARGGKKR